MSRSKHAKKASQIGDGQTSCKALAPAPTMALKEQKIGGEVQKTDRAELIAQCEESLGTITGVKSGKLALRLVSQVAMQLSNSEDGGGMIAAAAVLAELKPANLTEAMLATQMIGVHEAALVFLRNATADGQTAEGRDANTHRAVRLMRLFIEQLAAMAKSKGKTGQQKVVVEHVHVNAGGQAIVGAVTTPGGQGEGGEPW